MKFRIFATSVWGFYGREIDNLLKTHKNLKDFDLEYDEKSNKTYININTLEELTNLSKKIKVDIIFDGDGKILEIYDDYRE